MPGLYSRPSSPRPLIIDPTASGTVFCRTLLLEGLFNVAFGGMLIYQPNIFLNYLAISPSYTDPVAIDHVRALGVILHGITAPIIISYRNTRRDLESRVPTYCMLGSIDIGLIALFTYLAKFQTETDTGMSAKGLMFVVYNLLSYLSWRLYVINLKPEWIGRYKDAGKTE